MTRLSYGEPLSDDDVLCIQGVDYAMQPIGMRAMKQMLEARKRIDVTSDQVSEEHIDMMVDLIVSAVRPSERERLREHIDNTVLPPLLVEVMQGLMLGVTKDVDPTLLQSSSAGSSTDGPSSTAGAEPAALTPST